MKKILFPTDFSDASKNALHYALSVAERIDASIDVINIYHLPFADASSVPPEMVQRMLEEREEATKEKIDMFLEDIDMSRIREKRGEYGIFIATEITDLSKKQDYDLIVMGTKGERNPIEKFLGSVTTQVMMQALCPVLAVPMETSFREIENISYATDFIPSDEQAINQLVEFAKEFEAAVHFVHVETHPDIGKKGDEIQLDNYPIQFADFTIVNSPSIMEGLDDYMRQKDIDILALFIPKRRLWERLFHSSFSKKMCFHTKTPLLVFKE